MSFLLLIAILMAICSYVCFVIACTSICHWIKVRFWC